MINKDEINVIVVNKPTKEESEQKVKELCTFLEQVWTCPSKTDKVLKIL